MVIEAAVAWSGSMDQTADIIRPDIAIVTMVGLEHYSAFRGKEAIAREKGKLVEALGSRGLAVLNADDENVMSMAARCEGRVVTFGQNADADYRIVGVKQRYPGPLVVKLASRHGTHTVTAELIGKHFSMCIAAAYAAAMEIGVPVETFTKAVSGFDAIQGRCEPVHLDNGTTFLMDTVKAPWESLTLPMETVRDAKAVRKRIVIDQMSDYPGSSNSKYRAAYKAARDAADEVIFVGDNAHRHGASEEDRASGHIVEALDARAVHEHLRRTLTDGELVLLKSSQNLHLERAALAFNSDVKCWVDRCGKSGTCVQCGMLAYPYEEHAAIRKSRRQKRWKSRIIGSDTA
ncbi:UDP-N-acetylmuramoyl-tripeptide--D-alanyl-D-alanine ligase [Pseudohoeflea sp. DP4N28-3]|uniref:UDP-N-acetylmuramoyl-tripeptide--D-alanyl-D-alanine ligase n=1 Tax=Pseudohoeflea coraliihabitans TaxID=2860393 RepID=A0ABS6WJA0_9HYPH|nr:UDP-N-acetylmuramoyl-tripeptide--D-alanyl-D-alanine ligase [Pseudohoeflea sp. DP4N28-3]